MGSYSSDLSSRGNVTVTALLREASWKVGKDQVRNIWRHEGLKVPAKGDLRSWHTNSLDAGVASGEAVAVHEILQIATALWRLHGSASLILAGGFVIKAPGPCGGA